MKRRKRSRKRRPYSKPPAQRTRRKLDRIWEAAAAEGRREEEAQHQKLVRDLEKQVKAAQANLPKRDPSQIQFGAQHWWREEKYLKKREESGISIEEEKASMWYEAARRRPEVQRAWVEGKFSFCANDWQFFTGYVVMYLPYPWPALSPLVKRGLIETSYSPWAVPPAGYSTFPETSRAEQRKVSMQVFRLPQKDDPGAAQGFIERLRRFVDAGFLLVAVDKKQNQAVRAACEAIEALPRTFRKADLQTVGIDYLPPETSEAEKQAIEAKRKQSTLTREDFDRLWRKYVKPTSDLFAAWHTTGSVEQWILHKRKRGSELIEQKQFNFQAICRQLEAFDNGLISDFVNGVRL